MMNLRTLFTINVPISALFGTMCVVVYLCVAGGYGYFRFLKPEIVPVR